jgi:hypothetical protein
MQPANPDCRKNNPDSLTNNVLKTNNKMEDEGETN